MLSYILLVVALVLALAEAFRASWAPPRPLPHLGWLAFALWVLTLLLGGR